MRVHLGLRGWRRLAVVAASLVLVALLASCEGAGEGRPASDFQVTLFSGSSFRLSEQGGKDAVVLNFDKSGQVFKIEISTLNADVDLREMGLR